MVAVVDMGKIAPADCSPFSFSILIKGKREEEKEEEEEGVCLFWDFFFSSVFSGPGKKEKG